MTTTVRLISSAAELVAIEAAWNSLADGMPLRSYDWLATWWKHYGKSADGISRDAERQLFVLAVYRNSDADASQGSQPERGQLIGIAPWYLERVPVKGNVIRWLGSGEVCTDHASIVCRPDDCDETIAAIAKSLTVERDEWDQLELSAADADDPAIGRLLTQLESRECGISSQQADSCWTLDLPLSWDDYLAAVSKSHRKQLRQLERRVLESSRARWRRVLSATDLSEGWPILVDLHQRRRRALDEPGCFASRQFHDFHREVVSRFLDRGQLRMSWLDLDGSPIAVEYHLADGHSTYAYQGGVDPDRLAEEPGRLSTILCLKVAIREGHRQFDFLRGDEPYKSHWRATPRTTYDYRIVPNRRLARLRGRVITLAETMTDWVKQGTRALVE